MRRFTRKYGDFKISEEGFTNTGKPAILSTSITVD